MKIVKYGESVLRQKCKPVEEITPKIRTLAADMLETMYLAPGVGLAAPQVGVPICLCVIDVFPGGRRQPIVLINPRIVAQKDRVEEEEGCLSLPGIQAKVKRYLHVRVEAVNLKGFPVVVEGDGFLARALQHEIDHLQGKIFIDYLSLWGKKRIEQEIRKRKKEGTW